MSVVRFDADGDVLAIATREPNSAQLFAGSDWGRRWQTGLDDRDPTGGLALARHATAHSPS
jgi:hypothetical protein